MKICFMCDLHLPFDKNALQYDVLDWAIADAKKKRPDCIVFAGDATCNGNEDVYDFFIKAIKETDIPFLYIPGNSDLRTESTKNSIIKKASPIKTDLNGLSFFAINDSDGKISKSDLSALRHADENSIVFMHHPIKNHTKESVELFNEWRKSHQAVKIFHGHLHQSFEEDNSVSLQAMDPDKAIGESPLITYYDTDTKKCRKAYYFCPVPNDIYDYMGISCYDPLPQIQFAIDNKIKHLELRPNCVNTDADSLISAVGKWRKLCGKSLSIHLHDVGFLNGNVVINKEHDKLFEIIKELKPNRVTQHVPLITVKEVKENSDSLDKITDFIAKSLNDLEGDIVVGIENMHMTESDTPDENRRYGYLPEECLEFMHLLAGKCKHKVGVNFDVGHARNNAPFSQKYQIGTWFSLVGKHATSYHLHQVTNENGVFHNHMPITNVYGNLISFASFFRCWNIGKINHAPIIFEMRPSDAYEITFNTFNQYKTKKVFDLHSHTYFSSCGRDNPSDLVNVAINNGISILGISDHHYGIGKNKSKYLSEMKSLADKYADKIKIFRGVEIATVASLYDPNLPTEIKPFDYCLIEHITEKESVVKNNLFEFCDNLGILCGIAHTDIFKYCDIYGFDYAEFFNKMAKHNIFWELNVTYDSIHGYNEHQYVLDFMADPVKQKLVKDANVYLSIGFDSHRCEDYDGFKVHKAYEFLKKNGFNTAETLLNEN